MILTITDVDYKGAYTLICTFNNGAKKEVDLSPLLNAPAFKTLKNVNEFQKFGLDGTIFWSNGADIAPEWLLENGRDI